MVWSRDACFGSVVHFCCSNSLGGFFFLNGMSHECVRASEHGLDIVAGTTDSKGVLFCVLVNTCRISIEECCMLCANACVHVQVGKWCF